VARVVDSGGATAAAADADGPVDLAEGPVDASGEPGPAG
jgi:hypothetical protein